MVWRFASSFSVGSDWTVSPFSVASALCTASASTPLP